VLHHCHFHSLVHLKLGGWVALVVVRDFTHEDHAEVAGAELHHEASGTLNRLDRALELLANLQGLLWLCVILLGVGDQGKLESVFVAKTKYLFFILKKQDHWLSLQAERKNRPLHSTERDHPWKRSSRDC